MVEKIMNTKEINLVENEEYKELKMTFDLNTIDHLGVKLYNTFPPVIAELVSNSYDADAENVTISINYEDKKVIVKDDGHGMSFDEINDSFLVIGRNRRAANNNGFSKIKKRPVTGKKGLGKLAVFGVAEKITISSTSKNKLNRFSMNYNDIKDPKKSNGSNTTYRPDILVNNVDTDTNDGTTIILTQIKNDTITPIQDLSESLSSRFQIFDSDFNVTINDINKRKCTVVSNEDFYNRVEIEYEWNFPNDFNHINNTSFKWLVEKGIKGYIITKKTPFPQKQSGIIIYSRGKLVQEKTFFNDRSNDLFNTYVTGYFEIDFLDDSNYEDLVATDRRSLMWSYNHETIKLQEALDEVLKFIGRDWRKKREKEKEDKIDKLLSKDYFKGLSPSDKIILDKLKKQLIKSLPGESDIKKITDLLHSFKQQFQFESFKGYVAELHDEEITIENMEKISSDWELIETQELAKIALGRTETIKRFENFINDNASETKVIQPFLEKFPWILEPRLTTFDREVTFSRLLKKNFPDTHLDGPNRRIDFLCSTVNGELIIIELKRPDIKIGFKEIRQARDYERFIKEKRKDFTKIKTYLISDRYDMNEETKDFYESLNNDGKLEIKSYTDLIDQAKQYHKQFIDAQELISEVKNTEKASKKEI